MPLWLFRPNCCGVTSSDSPSSSSLLLFTCGEARQVNESVLASSCHFGIEECKNEGFPEHLGIEECQIEGLSRTFEIDLIAVFKALIHNQNVNNIKMNC